MFSSGLRKAYLEASVSEMLQAKSLEDFSNILCPAHQVLDFGANIICSMALNLIMNEAFWMSHESNYLYMLIPFTSL